MTLPEPLRNITTPANPIDHLAHTNLKKGQDTEATDWSNGKVGAFGISAAGVAFNMLALSQPPYRDHGDLIARASILLAASSPTNRSP